MPHGKKAPSKTATNSYADGILKEPTSQSAQPQKCTIWKKSSTQFIESYLMEKPPMNMTHPTTKPHKERAFK
jgi:hypothetical protein